MGVIDDIFDARGAAEASGQIVAASIPVSTGAKLGAFTLPFVGGVDPSEVDVPCRCSATSTSGEVLTILGIVAMINVINLIDGVDGLAAGVCVISALTLWR